MVWILKRVFWWFYCFIKLMIEMSIVVFSEVVIWWMVLKVVILFGIRLKGKIFRVWVCRGISIEINFSWCIVWKSVKIIGLLVVLIVVWNRVFVLFIISLNKISCCIDKWLYNCLFNCDKNFVISVFGRIISFDIRVFFCWMFCIRSGNKMVLLNMVVMINMLIKVVIMNWL